MAESAGFNAAPEARAARAARFDASTAETRYRKLEAKRTEERRKLEESGAINSGQTELQDAVDVRGTCETKCSEFEAAFREFTGEINPLEKDASGKLDPRRMVAAYTRSDAGAGLGAAAKLPSDLRTPRALVNSLDYLVNELLLTQPPSTLPSLASDRRALGHVSGFIRDRTRAIRKEFSLQTSWGSLESVQCHEKIARYHILALRELQEETGGSSDMHNDSAELGRCFTSLRQLYEDLAEDHELPNRAEMQAYMLLFDLRDKFTAISASQLPSAVFKDPVVKIAFELRKAAQCNFDSQKEGSKDNAELGLNAIKRYINLLRQPNVPFLLSCLAEIRLRELRRSALRALRGIYLTAKDPLVIRDGQIVEKRMIKVEDLVEMLGCEVQEEEPSAFDDITPIDRDQTSEVKRVVEKLGFTFVVADGRPMGALINKGADYKDNNDAPYTRRWALITEKRQGISFIDIVNGRAGVRSSSTQASVPVVVPQRQPSIQSSPVFTMPKPAPPPKSTPAFSFAPPAAVPTQSTPFSIPFQAPTPSVASQPSLAPKRPAFSFQMPTPKMEPAKESSQPAAPTPMFNFGASSSSAPTPAVPKAAETKSAPVVASPSLFSPLFAPDKPQPSKTNVQFPLLSEPTAQPVLATPDTVTSSPPKPAPTQAVPRYSAQDLALSVSTIFSAICAEVFSTLFDKDAWVFRTMVDEEVGERRAVAEAEAALAKQEEEEEEEKARAKREKEQRRARLKELRSNFLGRKYCSLWKRYSAEAASIEKERETLSLRVHHLGLGGNVWQVPLYRPASPIHEDFDIAESVPDIPRTPSPEGTPERQTNGHGHRPAPSISADLATTLGVFEDHITPLQPLQPTKRIAASPKRKRDWEVSQEGEKGKEKEEKYESSAVKMMRLERAMKAATRLITT